MSGVNRNLGNSYTEDEKRKPFGVPKVVGYLPFKWVQAQGYTTALVRILYVHSLEPTNDSNYSKSALQSSVRGIRMSATQAPPRLYIQSQELTESILPKLGSASAALQARDTYPRYGVFYQPQKLNEKH